MLAAQTDAQRIADSFRALSHPTRIWILSLLNEHERLSPRQLCDYLPGGVPLASIAYHARTLAQLGALRGAGTRPARGAIEHFYRLTEHGWALNELIDGLFAVSRVRAREDSKL
jgi:DNA-binding transcriptional ArsR family regulator